jgi:hypothetical protein
MEAEELPKPTCEIIEMMLVKKYDQVYTFKNVKAKIAKSAKLLHFLCKD